MMQNMLVINEKAIVNTTPHPIAFDVNGEKVLVPCDENCILNAKAVEEPVGDDLVRTGFVGTDDGEALIKSIEESLESYASEGRLRIVGSIIAAQAYQGRVVAMTPAKGYERVAPAEKRMNPSKFTTF